MGLLNNFRLKPIHDLREEVMASLTHLLTTKQTYGAWQKELGLDDYRYGNQSEGMLRRLSEDIALNIEKYEKRFKLQKIEVVSFVSFSNFTFEIEGLLQGKTQKFYIKINRDCGIKVSSKSYFT